MNTLDSGFDLQSALSHPLPDLTGFSLVFDLDGTLVETAGDLVGSLNDMLAAEDLAPVAVSDVRHLSGLGAAHLIDLGYRQAGRPLSPEQVQAKFGQYVARYAERIAQTSHLYEGVRPVLERLLTKGAILSVCTNKPHGLCLQLLEALACKGLFSAALGADAVTLKKPDRQHFDETVRRSGGDPKRAIMIGDSIVDIKTAQNAGVPVIAVSFGYSDQDISTLGADLVIDHFYELPKALAQILSTMRP